MTTDILSLNRKNKELNNFKFSDVKLRFYLRFEHLSSILKILILFNHQIIKITFPTHNYI